MISIKHPPKRAVAKASVSKKIETETPEGALMALCVRLCLLLGLPKSIGLIYGAVFASPKPVEAGQICRKLKISRGSVSTGLRFLKELGAIRSEGLNGGRAEHFVAEDHLRGAMENFVLKKISPAMDEIGEEIKHLDKILAEGNTPVLSEKLEVLRRWHRHGKLLFPLVTGFLKTIPLLPRK